MIAFDLQQLEAARQGGRAALDAVVRAVEHPIYNLAIRMLAHPTDAEDATQEILIRTITHLGDLRELEAAGGWAMSMSFEAFADTLQESLGNNIDDSQDPEVIFAA